MNKSTSFYCPYSGLKVIQKQEWKNLVVSDNYSVSFSVIGSNILLTEPSGDSNTIDLDVLYAHRQRVIDSAFKGAKYVEIRNFSKVKGMPPQKARLLQKAYSSNKYESEHCLGYYGYNATLLIKGIYNTGMLFNKTTYPVEIVSTYEAAIDKALVKLNEFSIQQHSVSFDEFITKTSWIYENPESDFKYRVKIFNDFIFYSELSGYANEHDHIYVENIVREVLKQYFFKRKYFRIADYSNLTGATSKARRMYEKSMNGLNQEYKAEPIKSYIIGANLKLKSAVLISSYINNYKVLFVDTFDEVKDHLQKKKYEMHIDKQKKLDNDGVFEIDAFEIERLTKAIGTFSWVEEPDNESNVLVSQDHPLRNVYDAINLMKNDLRSLHIENEHLRNDAHLKETLIETIRRDKNNFIADLSEELRSPIKEIAGISELIRKNTSDQKLIDFTQNIEKNVELTTSMFSGIIDYSKLTEGEVILNNSLTITSEIIDDLNDSFTNIAEQKKLFFNVISSSKVPDCFITDQQRYTQILKILIDNALKFTIKGGVNVDFDFIENGDLSNMLIVKITDSGIGISFEDRKQIFEPYKQLENDFFQNYGVGLGLSIATELANLMDGVISMESIPSSGSIFKFSLYNIKTARKDELKNRPLETDVDILPDFRFASALLIDGDLHTISYIEEICKLTHLKPKRVISVEDIFASLVEHTVNIIVINDTFKDISLIDLLSRIRAIVNYENINIILTVGNEKRKEWTEIVAGQPHIYVLDKPVNNKELLQILMKTLTFDLSR